MLQSKDIVDTLRKLLPDGDVTLEDEYSIDFSLRVGSKKLNGWAFIIGGENIILQIYCTGGTAPEHLPAVRLLISLLNFRIPFGSYQISDSGVVAYRTQCFAETVEHASFSIHKALEYANLFVEEHITGIAAVSEGFTTPEDAFQLIESKTGTAPDEGAAT